MRLALSLAVVGSLSGGCHSGSSPETAETRLLGTWRGEEDRLVIHLGQDGTCWGREDGGERIEGTYRVPTEGKIILSWTTESDPNIRPWYFDEDGAWVIVMEHREGRFRRVADED